MDFSPLTKRKKQNEFRRNESFLMIKYEPIRWIFVGIGFISDGLKFHPYNTMGVVPMALLNFL